MQHHKLATSPPQSHLGRVCTDTQMVQANVPYHECFARYADREQHTTGEQEV